MMDGVMKQCPSIEEVAIQAFNAGCDILLLGGKQLSGASVGFELKPGDIKQIHKALVRAVQEGRISLARVDEAVEKILRLKDRYLRFQEIPSIDIKSHKALSQKIASLALKTQINTPISLKGKKIALFAPEILRSSLAKIAEKKYFFSQLNPSKEEKKAAQVLAQTADVLVIYSYNSWKNPLQIAFIQSLLHVKKQTVLVITRDPQDAVFFPNANTIFTTYSPTEPSLEAAYSSL
jgi:beta-N-acetylhexosaminidase